MFEDAASPERRSAQRYSFKPTDLPGNRLVDHFSSPLALTLQLRAYGVGATSDGLRERVNRLFDQAESQALRAGKSSSDVSDALFAVVAFLDETIQGSDWPGKTQWLSNPLQVVRFNRSDAGGEFFNRLDSLRMDPSGRAEVLEVYYLALALGFKGKYQIRDAHELRRLIDDVYEDLAIQDQFRFKELSPRGRPRDQITAEVRTKMPMWAVLVAVFLVAVVAYVIGSAIVGSAVDDAEIKINSAVIATG